MSLIDYDEILDPDDPCAPHGLENCRICRKQRRDEAAIERMEAEKDDDEIR